MRSMGCRCGDTQWIGECGNSVWDKCGDTGLLGFVLGPQVRDSECTGGPMGQEIRKRKGAKKIVDSDDRHKSCMTNC